MTYLSSKINLMMKKFDICAKNMSIPSISCFLSWENAHKNSLLHFPTKIFGMKNVQQVPCQLVITFGCYETHSKMLRNAIPGRNLGF